MKTILVIDDDRLVRETTLDLLEVEGFQALGAEDGRKGIELAFEKLPDLIVCDIMMPDIDGYQVLARLQESDRTSAIPFIFLTAKADLESLRQGMEQGADDYLVKPFSVEQLLKAISTRLSKQEMLNRQYRVEIQQVKDRLSELTLDDSFKQLEKIARVVGATFLAVYSTISEELETVEPVAIYSQNSQLPSPVRPEVLRDVYEKREASYFQLEDHQALLAYLPLIKAEVKLGVMVALLPLSLHTIKLLDDELQWLLLLVAAQLARSLELINVRTEAAQLPHLKEAFEWQSTLLASVSHDLRTPLNTIKTATAGLLDEQVALEPVEQREYLAVIESEVDRLERLISSILNYSRIEAGLLRLDKGLFYLPELINEVVDRLRRSSILEQHQVITHFEERLPLFSADYVQLEQVLSNLLENAVRYSPCNSVIRIDVSQKVWPTPGLSSAKTGQMGIMVEIEDEGAGIPEAQRELIFQQFHRLENSSTGLGLGLAICRGIIKAHKGEIWVQPGRENRGCNFSFWLPL
ncbi:MAG TPA: response regulator [Chloroflexia bacterium]|nr:response regulator [Chloroflexia bacterium]